VPGLDITHLAVGFGCRAVNVDSTEKLAHEFTTALNADGPTVIVVPTKPQPAHLGCHDRSLRCGINAKVNVSSAFTTIGFLNAFGDVSLTLKTPHRLPQSSLKSTRTPLVSAVI